MNYNIDKGRFNAAGGIYGGSGKYAKKQAGEIRSSLSPQKGGSEANVKASDAVNNNDTDYTLERSVTTADKRPSVTAEAETAVEAEKEVEVEKVEETPVVAAPVVVVVEEAHPKDAPQLKERRASLKAVRGSMANDEITREAARLAAVELEANSPKKEQIKEEGE